MSEEAGTIAAPLFSFVVALAVTPIAIRVARRTNFHDEPARYKAHSTPTPYLGGAAVISAFAVSALFFAEGRSRFSAVLIGAVALWFVGTVDDRRTLRPALRVLAAAAAALLLWSSDLAWSPFQHDLANLALTLLWVVGLVNAFNLMDNMDGAAPTVAAMSGAGVTVLAIVNDDFALAALALALVGACIGFLKYNLATPARIFLGDGGSMPIGFVIAAAIMNLPELKAAGVSMLVPAILLVGLAVFDTTLVVVSRRRRGARICSGARDHVTHRLLPRLQSTRTVAIALALAQTVLCGVAIVTAELGATANAIIAVPFLAVAMVGLCAFELEEWPRRRRPVIGAKTDAVAGTSVTTSRM